MDSKSVHEQLDMGADPDTLRDVGYSVPADIVASDHEGIIVSSDHEADENQEQKRSEECEKILTAISEARYGSELSRFGAKIAHAVGHGQINSEESNFLFEQLSLKRRSLVAPQVGKVAETVVERPEREPDWFERQLPPGDR